MSALARRAGVVIAAAALAVAAMPLVASAQVVTSVEVPNAAEAWYATTSLSCSAPIGCLGGQPTSYPENTLHVAHSLGAETARTYLVPDLTRLPAGAAVAGGSMVLPLASDAEAGNNAPATAIVQACLVTGAVSDGVEASSGSAPAVDCAVTSPLVPSGGTGFTLDLAPFVQHWAGGKPRYGIALLPAAGQPATADWRVVFNARDRAGAAPITSTLKVGMPGGASGSEPAPNPAPAPLPAAQVRPFAPAPAPLVAAAPSPSPSPAPQPAVVDPVPVAPSVGPARVAVVSPLSYRGVVYLPLLFLLSIAFMVRTFARPIPVIRHERHAR